MEFKKEELIFQRGENGNLLPQDTVLLGMEQTVKIKPLTRGKLQEIFAKATNDDVAEKVSADNDVIMNGLMSPTFTEDELKYLKPKMATAIVNAILSISLDISQEDITKKTREVISDQDYLLKKK